MKHLSTVLTTVFIFITINFFYIEATDKNEIISITSYNIDINGDGFQEKITLKGSLLSNASNYYHTIWLEITGKDFHDQKVFYGGGYEPSIEFIDLTRNNKKEILFKKKHNPNQNESFYQLHAIQNGRYNEAKLPKLHYSSGQLKDNFILDFNTSATNKSLSFLIEDRIGDYIEREVYTEQGKLLVPTTIKVNPNTTFQPLYISQSKGYGLKSYNKVIDPQLKEPINTLETLWYFEGDKWIILQTTLPTNS